MIEAATALRYFRALRETMEGIEVSGRSNLSKVLGCMELLDDLISQCQKAMQPRQMVGENEREEVKSE